MTQSIPALPEPYATALKEAVSYIRNRYQSVGIVVSGTILRGQPHAASDLDLVVMHEPAWRQRTQRVFNRVPAEMFVNPAFQLRRQMAADAAVGRPVMAHMLATGDILDDPTGMMATLQREAKNNLAAGPTVAAEALTQIRYRIATAFEDAVDIRDIDADRAHAIVTEALTEAVKLHFVQQGRWLPRAKALLSDLDDLDPELGGQVRTALRCPDLNDQLVLAAPIIERIVGATGFFEWESELQELSPEA